MRDARPVKSGRVAHLTITYVFPPPIRECCRTSYSPGLVSAPSKTTILPLWSASARIAQAKHSPSCLKKYLVRRMPPARRTKSCLLRSYTRPDRLISRKRIAFIRRLTQVSPNTRRFMAEFRKKRTLCHNRVTSLVRDFTREKEYILLISREQLGFSIFLDQRSRSPGWGYAFLIADMFSGLKTQGLGARLLQALARPYILKNWDGPASFPEVALHG